MIFEKIGFLICTTVIAGLFCTQSIIAQVDGTTGSINGSSQFALPGAVGGVGNLLGTSDNYEQIAQSKNFQKTFLLHNQVNLWELTGSPWLDKNFKMGSVADALVSVEQDMPLRYNVYNDVFEVFNYRGNLDTLAVDQKANIIVRLDDQEFYYRNFTNNEGNRGDGYLMKAGMLGDKTVYVRFFQKVRMPKEAKTTLQVDVKGSITTYNYLVVEGEGFSEVLKYRKSDIIKLFPKEQKKLVQQIIKDENLKFRNYKDITVLLASISK